MRAMLVILLLVSVSTSRRSKRKSRTSSKCTQQWEGTNPNHLFPRCDVDQVMPEELTPELFVRKYSLKRPFILRNTTQNVAAREFFADRCRILDLYGNVPVDLGDPFSLVVYGEPSSTMSLRQYLDTPFDISSPLYFFDKHGGWTKHLGELQSILETPAVVQLQPRGHERPIQFAVGKSASGIGLHAHHDAWNQVLFGAKRWTIYPGSPGGVPPEAGYNPTEHHLQWLHDVYPKIKDDESTAPMECVQYAGDMIYVPEGWYHATVNLGDTASISQQTKRFTPGSPRELGDRSQLAYRRQQYDDAFALAREAQEKDSMEGDHYISLGHALEGSGRYHEAKAAFKNATRLMPRNPGAYYTLGKLLNAIGDYAKAGGALSKGKSLVHKAGEGNPLARGLAHELQKSKTARMEQRRADGL